MSGPTKDWCVQGDNGWVLLLPAGQSTAFIPRLAAYADLLSLGTMVRGESRLNAL